VNAPDLDLRRVGTPTDLADAGGPIPYLGDELRWAIVHQITNAPRSLQKRIGPSEIGIPCQRRIGYKLAGVEAVNVGAPPWKPFIGTAVHEALGGIMQWFNGYLGVEDGPRFLIEHKVNVGQVCGDDIDGSCDLYDRLNRTVIDWKVVGEKQLKKYKEQGPGDQYRIQAHTYGRGWQRRGLPVDHVAVMFLPRDRELRDSHWWHEPYDEQVAVQALNRAEGITTMVRALGVGALPLLPTADAYCSFCPYFLPASTEVEEACPGHPGTSTYVRR
jgi:hypothetical protein